MTSTLPPPSFEQHQIQGGEPQRLDSCRISATGTPLTQTLGPTRTFTGRFSDRPTVLKIRIDPDIQSEHCDFGVSAEPAGRAIRPSPSGLDAATSRRGTRTNASSRYS